jgi:hypothetical protein
LEEGKIIMDYSNYAFPNAEYFIRSPLGAYCIGLFWGFIFGIMIKRNK